MKSVRSNEIQFFDAGIDKKVSCMTMSKDGRYLATGHETMGVTKVEAIVWDLKSAVECCVGGDNGVSSKNDYLLHRLFQHHGKVQAVDFSCDGKFLITVGGQDDNALVVWDVGTGQGICGSPAANDTCYCVKWLNQRNDRFVTCGNYHFRVWQLCTATPKLHAVDASMGSIRRVMQCLSISNDDKFGFAGSKTGEVLKFRIDRDDIKPFDQPDDVCPSLKGYNKERFSKGVKSVICVINPNTGNTNVIAGAGDGVVQLLNPSLQLIQSHKAELDGGVTSLSLDPSSKSFLVGTELSQRYSIDISSFTPELRGTCHYAEIFDLKFPTQCSELFVTASVQDIRVWNARQRQELLRIKVPNMSCYAIDITNSGSNIVSAWSDGKIRSFLPESGKVRFVIPDAHPDSVTALTTCNDDDLRSDWRLVSGGNDGGIRVWLITKSHQRMLHSMKEHRGTINSVVCNKDGSQIISASADGSFIVWDLGKGIRIHALFDQTVFKDVLFHPDESQYLTCQTNCKISYWDAYDGSAIRVIDGGDTDMTCLDIKPDGNIFVSGSADKSVRVWNYDDGITIGIGQRHSGKVSRVAISPDQQNLVSVGSEGGIFIWDISDMRQ
jgi:WD40 repeat protein